MANEIFRKKSIDRIQSPEDLNEYVRVARPGIWLVLAAVIVLLAGLCVWGIFGTIQSSVPAKITVTEGKVVCTVAANDAAKIKAGMAVETSVADGTVKSVTPGADTPVLQISLPDGEYDAQIVTERLSPFSLAFN